MRIDKLIDSITKILFPPSMIDSIIKGKISSKFVYFSKLISFKKKLLLSKRGPFKGLKNIEGLKEYNITKESFDFHKKKDGISALGRFKNSGDFLEICIKSILPYVDEVIMLVDTSSTDNTLNICQMLEKEYSHQCKLYVYNSLVYPGNHKKYLIGEDDSIHALSYFYNYCMSKSSYKYVMKFDDDMLCVGEEFGKISNNIKKQGINYFLDIPQINISRDDNGNIAIANKYLSSGIAGIFGDHGIFPISDQTYFFNDIGCENLIMPYRIVYSNVIGFLHLKNLKQGGGVKNYEGYGVEYIKKLNQNTGYLQLPKKYINILTKRGIE